MTEIHVVLFGSSPMGAFLTMERARLLKMFLERQYSDHEKHGIEINIATLTVNQTSRYLEKLAEGQRCWQLLIDHPLNERYLVTLREAIPPFLFENAVLSMLRNGEPRTLGIVCWSRTREEALLQVEHWRTRLRERRDGLGPGWYTWQDDHFVVMRE